MCGSSKTACAPYKRTEKGRCRNVLRRPFFALRTGGCQGSDLSPEHCEIFEAPGALDELRGAAASLRRGRLVGHIVFAPLDADGAARAGGGEERVDFTHRPELGRGVLLADAHIVRLLRVRVDGAVERDAGRDGGAVHGLCLDGAAVVDGRAADVYQDRRGGVLRRDADTQRAGRGALVGQHQILQRNIQRAVCRGEIDMIFGERREGAGRRQLLLAGLKVQLIAARRILSDGDDRCFTVFALGTLNTLLALFTGIALLALRTLNTLLSLRSRTAAVALRTLWTDLALNMQEDKEAVFDCVDTVKMCLRVFTPMIAAMKACTCNMYRAAQRGFLNATDLADYLTKKGLPFRAAYKIAGQLVAYCIEHTAVLEELPLAPLRQYSERFDEDVYAAIALTNCVTGRTSLGGTCVASVEAQIASVRDFLAGQTEAAKQAENG